MGLAYGRDQYSPKPHMTNRLDAGWLNKGSCPPRFPQVIVNRRFAYLLRALAEVAEGPEAEGVELFELAGFAEHSGGFFRRPGRGKTLLAVG